MRPILHGDVSVAARALLAAPHADRGRLCARLIAEAEVAHHHVDETGRVHPVYGNGSLMAAAMGHNLADEPSFDDVTYCQCFEMVLHYLIRFHITQRRS